MAAIVYLKPGERPPPDGGWLLVSRDLKGLYTVIGPSADQRRAIYVVHSGLGADLTLAIEKAGNLADDQGISTVLVETTRAG